MICVYCKLTRADNAAPCANCGAPSPIQARSQNTSWNADPRPEFSFPQQQNDNGRASSSWQQQPSGNNMASSPWQQQAQSMPSNSWQQQPSSMAPSSWQQQAPSMPQWSQIPPSPQPAQNVQPQAEISRLPAPYQGGMGLQPMPQGNGMQLMPAPAQDINIAAPQGDEDVVYVPPMYTKPRPIIPRYRIISGFLSFVIVTLMLCGGAGYYAKASGKLDLVSRVITGNNPAPPNIMPGNATLPDPSDQIIKGPAYNTIPSATTTTHLINSTIAAQTDRVFKPNQTFYLTYSVYPQKAGRVTIKWYMNNLPYRIMTSPNTLPAGQGVTGMAPMVYATSTEGKVEIDWENQPAQTLFFVVRN